MPYDIIIWTDQKAGCFSCLAVFDTHELAEKKKEISIHNAVVMKKRMQEFMNKIINLEKVLSMLYPSTCDFHLSTNNIKYFFQAK